MKKMGLSNIQRLDRMTSGKSFELCEIARQLGDISLQLRDSLERAFLCEQLIEIVENLYDIGKVIEVYEIFGGYINRNFGIVVQKNGISSNYFVRKYKLGITEDEIKFEHALINHSIFHGLTIAAGIIVNREGTTYVKPANSRSMFALYEFLKGEDKYTWDNPTLNDEEYASAAEVLAIFHNASKDFDPKGLKRVEKKILDFVPTFPEIFTRIAKEKCNTKFYRYYANNLDHLLHVVENTRIAKEDIGKMPLNPIHCDFHPGNLKFEDNRVVGIFDFDWSKIDLRLFDVCFALLYCCSRWYDKYDGEMRLGKCADFLRTYQKTLGKLGGLEPLNSVELQNLLPMLTAANLYLINWIVSTYHSDSSLNDYEYLAYLKHTTKLMYWIEEHKADIEEMVATIH
jgi:homoserine kinase type II